MVFSEGTFCDFETECKVWNLNSVKVGINLNTDNDVEDYHDIVTENIAWIDRKRHLIEQAILENRMTESAEFWVSECEKAEDGRFILADGSRISVPISDNDFCKSLRIAELTINIEEDGTNDMEIYFICKPDYFAGHCIEMTIDSEKNIVCDGLSG